MSAPREAAPLLTYQPALDGLRAVAILAVLAYHSPLVGLRAGFLGVNVFFVLSGFLITGLLLDEQERRGSISLRDFYARRALRIGPALLVVLAVVLVLTPFFPAAGAAASVSRSAWAVLTLSANRLNASRELAPVLAHTWSLSVEEQFYLVWPALLVLMLRVRMPRALLVSATLLAVLFTELSRLRIWSATHSYSHALFLSRSAMGGILVGCATALVLHRPRSPAGRDGGRALGLIGTAAAGVMLLILLLGARRTTWLYQGGIGLLEVAVALVIVGAVSAPREGVGRVLSLAPLVRVGRLSYSLYLWHLPAFVVVTGMAAAPSMAADALGWIVTFVLALLSYRFVERPVLKLRRRFEPGRAAAAAGKVTLTNTR